MNNVFTQQLGNTGGLWERAEIAFTYNNSNADQIRFITNSVGTFWVDDLEFYHEPGDSDVYYDFYRNGTVVADWHFDEGSGNYSFDETGNNNTISIADNENDQWTSGKYGQGLEFDGSDDFASINNTQSFSPSFTVEAWINPKQYYGYHNDIVSKRDSELWTLTVGGPSMDAQYQNKLMLLRGGDPIIYSLDDIPLDSWTFVTLTFDDASDSVALYVNGSDSSNSSTTSYSFNQLEGNLTIGMASQATGGYYFNGTIDEVKIYSRVLSADEVLCHYGNNCSAYGLWNETEILGGGLHYYTARSSEGQNYTSSSLLLPLNVSKAKPSLTLSNNTASVNTSSLVGYWKFDEGSGNTTYDKSGYDNTGTLQNSDNDEWVSGRFGSAIEFDGSNDYVSLSNLTGMDEISAFTVSLWVKLNTEDHGYIARIITINNESNYEAFRIFQYRPSNPEYNVTGAVRFNDGSIDNGLNLITNDNRDWNLISISYDGSNVRYYSNAELIDTNPAAGKNVSLTFITMGTEGSSYYNGTIDDVMIFNRSLTADEIKELYESSVTYGTQTNFSISESNTGDDDVYYDFYRNGTVAADWHFDEGSGNYTFDETGNNNTGTLQNSTYGVPTWTTGRFGKALEFDGEGDFIKVPKKDVLEFNTTDKFTVEAWVYPRSSEQRTIISLATRFYLEMNPGSDLIYFGYRNSTSNAYLFTNSTTIDTDTWYHCVLVHDGLDYSLYLNGEEVGNGTHPDEGNYSGSGSNIGAWDGWQRYWNGTIDELKVYSRVLTSTEVLCHYGNNCSLYGLWNDTEVLGGGYYSYNTKSSGGQNYTSSSLLLPLNVTKASNPVNLYLNGTLNDNRSYTSPEVTNATGTSLAGTVYLYRDGVEKANGSSPQSEIVQLSNGTYAYKVNATGNENYTDNLLCIDQLRFVLQECLTVVNNR